MAYAIGKPVGSAVTRNRVRRRLRVIVSELAADLAPGTYLIATAPAAADLTFDEMRASVSTAIAALRPAPNEPPPPAAS